MVLRLSDQYALIPFLEFREETHVITTISGQILGCDFTRVAVLFSNNGSNNVFLHSRTANPPLAGLLIPPANLPYEINFRKHGIKCGEPWFAVSQTGNSALFVTEILYTPRRQKLVTSIPSNGNGFGG